MQYFVDVVVEWQYVDYLVYYYVGLVDQEGALQCNVGFFKFDVVGVVDFVFDVGNQWIVDLVDVVVFDGGVFLGQVGELGVD